MLKSWKLVRRPPLLAKSFHGRLILEGSQVVQSTSFDSYMKRIKGAIDQCV